MQKLNVLDNELSLESLNRYNNSNQIESTIEKTMEKKDPKRRGTMTKKIMLFLLFLIILLVSFSLLIAYQGQKVVNNAKTTIDAAKQVYDSGKNQDLITANQKLEDVKQNLAKTQTSFRSLQWIKWFPVVGNYWNDGNHALRAANSAVEATDVLFDTLEPYADVLGFKGQGSFLGGTAEDRIVKAVETLDKVTPQLDTFAEKLEIIVQELNYINPKRYPFTYEGRKIGDNIKSAQNYAQEALFAVSKAKPALTQLPKVMGVDAEKKYMVLFQNDAELRATGGFLTAYAVLRVDKGKIFQEKSEDIYALDEKFNSQIPAPELIRKYHKLVFRQYLRDINLSPDFKVSMDDFSRYYNKIPGEPKVNGIIAVDTQVLKDIVEILGPIEVAGYGTYSTENDKRCDCPQIVYELEALADRPVATLKSDRKGILAPMLQSILIKSYAAPKQIWPKLFETIIRNISEKHVLFYLYDEEQQKAAELINIAGRINDYQGDYLHINDMNFAGAKTNMFTNQEVEQLYKANDNGNLTKTLTIKYQNPYPASNCNLEAGELCLNGILRNVVRVYVPKGSQLVESLGSEVEVETKEELGKTVFEAFFTLQPQAQAKLVLTYQLPLKGNETHKLLIQKQPGTKNAKYNIITPNDNQEFNLERDKEVDLAI